jgi:serine/threonine protein kinase
MLRPYSRAQITFDLTREIGQDGRNSRTFLARDHQLDAEIVIKEVQKAHLASAPSFFEESKALYASAHPNVVQIHYACEDANAIYIGMPFYRRGSVHTLMTAKRLTVREIVALGCNVLSGLHNIHSKGLIHFDVKPANVLLSDRGEGLLSDFGLAKQMNFTGVALQDRLYNKMISPEATRGGDQFDRTFDIYQFGLTLYRMCTGDDAFNGQYAAYGIGSAFDRTCFRNDVRNGRFPDRHAFPPHVPSRLRGVIRKCIEANPADRYQSAVDVSNALADISGEALDWQLVETSDKRVWTKTNEDGDLFEFTVPRAGPTECYKTVSGGQRRRHTAGCKPTMTQREIRTFLGSN